MSVSTESLDGMFKNRYADKIERLQPEFNKIARAIPFKQRKRLGATYNQPVRLRRAMGTTYAGGTTTGTAFALNAPVSGLMKNATTSGSEFVLRESIAYKTVMASQSNEAAFADAYDEVVMDMTESAAFHEELNMLYGQSPTGIGEVATHTDDSATQATLTLTSASWAPGLWVQFEGGLVDLVDDPNGSPTQRNTTGAYTVTAVDASARTVTITGASADITAVTNGDMILPRGAQNVSGGEFNWMVGLDRILTNTGSLFGIDASVYSLWQSNTEAAGGAVLTMATLTNAAAKTVVRGGMHDLKAYVSTYTWTDLNNDFTALRRYADSTKGGIDKGTRGDDDAIKYHGPNGTISIIPHPMVKAGEAMLLNPSHFCRVGASPLTFNLPGSVEGGQPRFFQQLSDNAGFELRCYWDQALMPKRPAGACKITGIVNNAG